MNTKYFVLLLLCPAMSAHSENSYKLPEAIKQGLVTVKINGATPDTAHPYSFAFTHTGPCMEIQVLNKGALPIALNLDYGYKLVPDDSSLQTMLVTQTMQVKLQPKQKRSEKIYAMCTEATDAAPSADKSFYMGKRASGNLLELAGLIERKKYQNDAAQSAVWCLTNNHALFCIYDSDTTMMYDLRRFVAKAKGIPLSKIYESDEPLSQQTITTRTIYSGSISYNVVGNAKIMVALFDEDNHMKRIYINNEMQREGQYTYGYQITGDEMNNKKHYLRMFRNGKMEEEVKIEPNP